MPGHILCSKGQLAWHQWCLKPGADGPLKAEMSLGTDLGRRCESTSSHCTVCFSAVVLNQSVSLHCWFPIYWCRHRQEVTSCKNILTAGNTLFKQQKTRDSNRTLCALVEHVSEAEKASQLSQLVEHKFKYSLQKIHKGKVALLVWSLNESWLNGIWLFQLEQTEYLAASWILI